MEVAAWNRKYLTYRDKFRIKSVGATIGRPYNQNIKYRTNPVGTGVLDCPKNNGRIISSPTNEF